MGNIFVAKANTKYCVTATIPIEMVLMSVGKSSPYSTKIMPPRTGWHSVTLMKPTSGTQPLSINHSGVGESASKRWECMATVKEKTVTS